MAWMKVRVFCFFLFSLAGRCKPGGSPEQETRAADCPPHPHHTPHTTPAPLPFNPPSPTEEGQRRDRRIEEGQRGAEEGQRRDREKEEGQRRDRGGTEKGQMRVRGGT